ncbi:UNKNOWN [Stylonychia lemnae]|uniref:Transmembrane protein n=1 Tax=Stylonychia lemnae TaxID=5949 RepID=A0A078AIA1_STYLE|nr:UNKNOWN [Stylonychia lemnae]|eukprot:CDW81990.1 UNKNOWN [Stylonychia lemnae]
MPHLRIKARKFSKFYINNFKPITKHEDFDHRKSIMTYRGFCFIGCLTLGFMSFRARRFKLSGIEGHQQSRDPQFLINVLNDGVSAFVGFVCGQLIACDYIYKHRQYVMERLFFEKYNNFNRDLMINQPGFQLQEEYLFSPYVQVSDADMKEERLHPSEVKEDQKRQQKTVERIQQEYEKQQKLQTANKSNEAQSKNQ